MRVVILSPFSRGWIAGSSKARGALDSRLKGALEPRALIKSLSSFSKSSWKEGLRTAAKKPSKQESQSLLSDRSSHLSFYLSSGKELALPINGKVFIPDQEQKDLS